MKLKLSIIIPAYNEEKIIKNTVEQVLFFMEKKPYKWEVIVVDDGSWDKTYSLAQEFKAENVRCIRLDPNRGKGGAIRAGVMEAKGEVILFFDADLSVPLVFIDTFLKRLEDGADIAIGTRRVRGARIIKHQDFIRESLGRGYTLLSKIITFTNISDFTCGFKAFTREAALAIFSKTLLSRWAYDSEIIFLGRKFKFKIVEIPVEWKNRENSRVSVGSAVFISFSDLLSVRLNDILGKYD